MPDPTPPLRRLTPMLATLVGLGLTAPTLGAAEETEPAPAPAPASERSAADEGPQAIVIEGTRVGETTAETATSVEVFTAEDFATTAGTREVRDLYQRTPNVVDFGEGNFAPAIRGIDATGAASGGLGFIAGTRPRATLTIDGRPLSTFEFVGGPAGLWDVEQVEVYRGPQTTLQGRNSIAGAIMVETKDPTYHWEGAARLGTGTHDRYQGSGMISGPIVADELAFRLAVDYLDAESYVDFQGPQAIDDVEEDERLTLRGKLRYEPQALPDFSAQLTIARVDTRRPQSQLSDKPFDERERTVSQTVFETESTDLILDLGYDFDERFVLTNSTTYSDLFFDRLDAAANGQFELDGPQITNETLLRYRDEDRGLSGILGGYLFHEDREDLVFGGTGLEATFEDETFTTSLFGELTWAVREDLRLTAGVRYESEDRERRGTAFGITTDLDETFDAVLPKLGIAYDIDEAITVGAVIARGFNPGGGSVSFGATDSDGNPSPDPAAGPRSFVYDEEYVWNYEVYLRAGLLEDRLFVDANLFYSDWEDQQRVEQISFAGGFTETVISNTPESRSYGAEIGLSYHPIAELDLTAGLGFLDTEIEESGDPTLEGNEFARAPNLTATLGTVYRPAADWSVGADARYTGSYYSTDANSPTGEVDDFVIVNAQVAWSGVEHLRVSAEVTNLFDSDAERRLFAFPATSPPTLANVVEPRTFWLSVEGSF